MIQSQYVHNGRRLIRINKLAISERLDEAPNAGGKCRECPGDSLRREMRSEQNPSATHRPATLRPRMTPPAPLQSSYLY